MMQFRAIQLKGSQMGKSNEQTNQSTAADWFNRKTGRMQLVNEMLSLGPEA